MRLRVLVWFDSPVLTHWALFAALTTTAARPVPDDGTISSVFILLSSTMPKLPVPSSQYSNAVTLAIERKRLIVVGSCF